MTSLTSSYTRPRKFFMKIPVHAEIPYLIEVQKQSYNQFLQADIRADQRKEVGLHCHVVLLAEGQRTLGAQAHRQGINVVIEMLATLLPPAIVLHEKVCVDESQMLFTLEAGDHVIDHDLMPFSGNPVEGEDAKHAVGDFHAGNFA